MDRLIDDFLQDLELSGRTEGTALHYRSCLQSSQSTWRARKFLKWIKRYCGDSSDI